MDVRACDRDEEKPVYYIIFSTLDIAGRRLLCICLRSIVDNRRRLRRRNNQVRREVGATCSRRMVREL